MSPFVGKEINDQYRAFRRHGPIIGVRPSLSFGDATQSKIVKVQERPAAGVGGPTYTRGMSESLMRHADRLRPFVERAHGFSGWMAYVENRKLGPDHPWDYM